ncbi:MAG: hypothetical protein MI741_07480, partial [Rhodospirillales bacterium]|nr:hypothetical protein [Rhodospirillales bacterium]
VPHFRFVSEDELDSYVYQYDAVVEVVDSQLIKRLAELGEIADGEVEAFHHVVIGFNETGAYLIVVFRDLEV